MWHCIVGCIVTFTLSLVVVPRVTEAQPTGQIYRIGWLAEGVRPEEPFLLEALRVLGYVEGHNLVIERRFAETREDLPALAAELVTRQVDLIMTNGTPTCRILNGLLRGTSGAHPPAPPAPPPATTDRPRLFPRAQGRGAARLSLGLDRRLRMGEGSASAVPWEDGCGKGDWAGWRGRFMGQPDALMKLAEFPKTSAWQRQQVVEKGGWATLPGSSEPNAKVAGACAEQLIKTQKT
jgi:hypothetical protein